jgi:formamidopyrimidine-DNA glycosylase
MPELPEVETVVRGLRAVLPGRSIVDVRLGKTDFIDDAAALADVLPQKRIVSVERMGKFICLKLSAAEVTAGNVDPAPAPHIYFVVHLGMTGRLYVRPRTETTAPHTHVFCELDDGRELRYTDIRRFGRMLLLADSAIDEFRGRLGEDALDVNAKEFSRRLAGRHAQIKALLLDQRILRGIGNIYADESLWEARIHPARLAARLGAPELAQLRQAIRRVLRNAIRVRGSSISNFVDTDGIPGSYQTRHRVYGREGEPCVRCGTAIRRIIVAGRSSHFCPRCQRAARVKQKSGKRGRRK